MFVAAIKLQKNSSATVAREAYWNAKDTLSVLPQPSKPATGNETFKTTIRSTCASRRQ